ncbi:hypothetical protein [Nonomuraea jiangxiensis]|uniref:Peptidase inhibitor family I36 n=1 Tax=Nonomuraea jiangxiensis TaxID=633440 RepID=A0A1G8QNU8_9ACTN|nr:hypothetical protein [Nonomuraea jiangxiensis]SDJ06301.1 hypothetical protein SAMN05421869_108308 [Nonomuraea jiangxiensis]
MGADHRVHRSPIQRKRSGRIGRMLIVTSAVLVAAVALAGPASADPPPVNTCTGGTGHTICFSLDRQDDGNIAVHLGIDVAMSRADAQAIIDHPGEEFSAKIFGDDPVYDNGLVSVPVTWSAAWDGGLSAEFDRVATFAQLNEDDGYFDGYIDELYGRIELVDFRSGQTRGFNSAVITGYY